MTGQKVGDWVPRYKRTRLASDKCELSIKIRAKTSVQDREEGSLGRHGIVVKLRRGAAAEGTMQSRDGRGDSVAGELLQNEE
jgi:hypothetical protein